MVNLGMLRGLSLLNMLQVRALEAYLSSSREAQLRDMYVSSLKKTQEREIETKSTQSIPEKLQRKNHPLNSQPYPRLSLVSDDF